MGVKPSNSRSRKAMSLDEDEHFLVLHHRRFRQRLKQLERYASCSQVSAGNLADDEGVAEHLPALQSFGEGRTTVPEVVDPDG